MQALLASGRTEELMDKVFSRYQEYRQAKDMVIVEGTTVSRSAFFLLPPGLRASSLSLFFRLLSLCLPARAVQQRGGIAERCLHWLSRASWGCVAAGMPALRQLVLGCAGLLPSIYQGGGPAGWVHILPQCCLPLPASATPPRSVVFLRLPARWEGQSKALAGSRFCHVLPIAGHGQQLGCGSSAGCVHSAQHRQRRSRRACSRPAAASSLPHTPAPRPLCCWRGMAAPLWVPACPPPGSFYRIGGGGGRAVDLHPQLVPAIRSSSGGVLSGLRLASALGSPRLGSSSPPAERPAEPRQQALRRPAASWCSAAPGFLPGHHE